MNKLIENKLRKLIQKEIKTVLKESTNDDEADRLLKIYKDYQSKYMSMNRFKPGTAPYIKSIVNKALSDYNKYIRNKEKKSLNIDAAKKIFKELGLKSVTYRSTAIRGFSIPSSNSYEISKHDPKHINFHGINNALFQTIVSKLEDSGFDISSTSEPSKAVAGPSISYITLK